MNTEKELWVPIASTGGAIEVSNLGRVRSNLREKGRILKPTADRKGYQRIRVTIKRERMSFKVHREVAKAFLPNPRDLPQVNHKDGNKSNNNADNLEWVTNKENAHHAVSKGLWKTFFEGAARENEKRKTPIIATDISTGDITRFESVSDAERFFGTKHVVSVLKKRRTQAKGHTFKYASS